MAAPVAVALKLGAQDVVPTGNEWISFPAIRSTDAAIESFNVMSMRDRGLLEVRGEAGRPALTPTVTVGGRRLALANPSWEVLAWWIPRATFRTPGLTVTVTVCAPPGVRGAIVRLTARNTGGRPLKVGLGLTPSWGGLHRVIYDANEVTGRKIARPAAWVREATVYSLVTHDTYFSWCLAGPANTAVTLAPGATADAVFRLGVGVEEFSAAQSARVLGEHVKRETADGLIAKAAAWCMTRTRTTGRADLDRVMNRNFLFTLLFAWGRTIDTEELVGVTARSARYYVSAAYWDRDSMTWSLPALVDVDPALAREALDHALGRQLRNTGIHSRFIDGTVLEDGYQLDEGAAPFIAIADYIRKTGDVKWLNRHAADLRTLEGLLQAWYRPATGLFATFQDSQDEYIHEPYGTYSMTLTWRALRDLAYLYGRLGDQAAARRVDRQAARLKAGILKWCVASGAPGAGGPIFARATDLVTPRFDEVPPGSLLRLALLGLVKEDDPVFVRTWDWLHSRHHRYSNHGLPYGLPGSFRVPATGCWNVADQLRFRPGRARALKILLESDWDGGIICEQVNPKTGRGQGGGGAFGTAAGYVAHAIYEVFGK